MLLAGLFLGSGLRLILFRAENIVSQILSSLCRKPVMILVTLISGDDLIPVSKIVLHFQVFVLKAMKLGLMPTLPRSLLPLQGKGCA